jgi:endonuclease/exonuclease/phosphatase family metal-dependent hydrolase
VRVVDVHLTNWDFDARVRRDQLEETLRWAADRQAEVPADLVVFGGDFNIESNSSDLDMMYDSNFTRGVAYRGYNNPLAVTRNGKRVDYIFIATPGNRSSVAYMSEQTMWPAGLKFASGGRFRLSDHLPVLQEYRVSSAVAARTAAETVAAAQ